MKRKTKTLSAILALLLVLSLFAGCGGNTTPVVEGQDSPSTTPAASVEDPGSDDEETPDTETPVEAEPVVLTALLDNSYQRDGFDAAAAKIKEDLNISVEVEIRPAGAEGENILRTRFAANEMTDILFFNSGALLPSMDPATNMLDLTGQPFMDKLSDAYKQTVTLEGKTYGVPEGSSLAGAWLYNRASYEELGLQVPKTWAQLMENCETIKAAGKTAIIGSFGTDWTSQLILLADYYNVQAADPGFAQKFNTNQDKYATNPHALRAFEKMAEVHDRKLMNVDYNATTLDIALDMLINGDGVHYPMLTNQLSKIVTNYDMETANTIGVFGQPGDNPDQHGITVWMPASFYIYKGSEKTEDALRFLTHYVEPDTIAAYASVKMAVGPYVVSGAGLPDDAFEGVKEMLPYYSSGRTAPALEFITAVKGPNSPQICIQALSGQKSALDTAKDYDRDVEVQAKQLGLAGW